MIKKYTKKDGSTAYMFKKYLGIDPITGKQKETTRRGFSSLKEAKVALSRLEYEIATNGISSNKIERTYNELYEEWLEIIYKKKVKESTFYNTQVVFKKHILPVFGHLKANKVNVVFCQKQANEWAETSPKRYKRTINYAGMIFQYGVSIGELNSNPMSNIILPAQPDIEEPDTPNFYERDMLVTFLDRMKASFPIKRYAFFYLLAFTGLRKGEAMALQWRDIDFKKNTLTISKTLAVGLNGKLIIQKPKTKASNGVVTLDMGTIEVLKEWKKNQNKELKKLGFIPNVDQLVFSTSENNILNPRTPQSWLDSFYTKYKDMLRITVHGFRHTHASLLFSAGANMKQVQERLRHSNIRTTGNIYVSVTQDDKQSTADLFASFIENGKKSGSISGSKKIPTSN